jgi:hypothetical protein
MAAGVTTVDDPRSFLHRSKTQLGDQLALGL